MKDTGDQVVELSGVVGKLRGMRMNAEASCLDKKVVDVLTEAADKIDLIRGDTSNEHINKKTHGA